LYKRSASSTGRRARAERRFSERSRTLWRHRAAQLSRARTSSVATTRACIGIESAKHRVMKSDALKDRVEARKHELLARLHDLKADTRTEAKEARTKVKHELDELELHLKEGWDRLSETTRAKLDQWLKH
jgi:hypothetical protein